MKKNPMKSENENNVLIPPAECLENGCKKRSKKCVDCPYSYCAWLSVPVDKLMGQDT